jgi:glutathione S-transferase
MSFIASTIHPARRMSGDRAERYVFEGSVERWNEVFEIAEKRLRRRNWAVGCYSIADIHLFRLYWRFVESTHPAPAPLRASKLPAPWLGYTESLISPKCAE